MHRSKSEGREKLKQKLAQKRFQVSDDRSQVHAASESEYNSSQMINLLALDDEHKLLVSNLCLSANESEAPLLKGHTTSRGCSHGGTGKRKADSQKNPISKRMKPLIQGQSLFNAKSQMHVHLFQFVLSSFFLNPPNKERSPRGRFLTINIYVHMRTYSYTYMYTCIYTYTC